MSKITERAYNIASAVYPPSDERHLFIKDLVEIAQQKAVAEAAPNVDRLVTTLDKMIGSIDLRFMDQPLADVYRVACEQQDEAGHSWEVRRRAAMRALALAALGIEAAP